MERSAQKKQKVLYISLTGMAEALGQSQVFQYLTDLSETHKITLFSFERTADQKEIPELTKQMNGAKINWFYHRYSNRFGVFSAMWMLITAFFRLLGITLKAKPTIIHVRSFLPALLGWPLAKLYRAKFLFDIRGFAMDEKIAEGRLKKHTFLYKFLHSLEKYLYQHCDHLVTLTFASKKILSTEFGLAENKITVIPTCASNSLFYPRDSQSRHAARELMGFKTTAKILLRPGSINRYDFEKEVQLFAALYEMDQNFHFIILNKNQVNFINTVFHRYNLPASAFTLSAAPFKDMPYWINMADMGIFFPEKSYANEAAAPTKFAEFIACHVPCIVSAESGDIAYYLQKYPVGIAVSLENFAQNKLEYVKKVITMLNQKTNPEFYAKLFSENFDKKLAIARYQAIYKTLNATL